MPDKIRAHISVLGRVQGVFFRANTKKKAKKLGVKGWVKNLKNGQIEAIFEGEKTKVEEMVDWARRGPAFAKVDYLKVSWDDCKDEFEDFNVEK
jgi:acylphosphatase